jgi:hypothetical protein
MFCPLDADVAHLALDATRIGATLSWREQNERYSV